MQSVVPGRSGGIRSALPRQVLRRRSPRKQTRATSSVAGVKEKARPNKEGRFGRFGGQYVPDAVLQNLKELEVAFYDAKADDSFKARLYTGGI